MSYLVLARKHRPALFQDVVGQQHISLTLKNAIKLGKIAHAYVFSGSRGVGKTSMARILAKALNCKNPTDYEPCGRCSSCEDISKGSFIDIIEIDAASNRGIEDIRALRENVKFTPAYGKYKVYIIDEAHQITQDAYNALLKTLEEPPAHVIFILATTDPHKIPITIFSRCQRFMFRPLTDDEIIGQLQGVASKESVGVEEGVFELLARSAGGSMRDALSIFDQIISFSQGKIKLEDARYVLGYMPDELMKSALEAVKNHDPKEALALIDKIFRQGFDLAQFARNMLECFHDIMLAKCGCQAEALSVQRKELAGQMKDELSEEEIIRGIDILEKAVVDMRRTGEFRLILQVCLFRLTMSFVPLDKILEKIDNITANSQDNFKVGSCSAANYDAGSNTSVMEEKSPDSVANEDVDKNGFNLKTADAKENAPARDEALRDQSLQGLWKKTVDEIDIIKPSISPALKDASIKSAGPNNFELLFSSKFNLAQFERNKGLIEKKFEAVSRVKSPVLNGCVSSLIENVKISEGKFGGDGGVCEEIPSESPADDISAVKNDPAVKKVLDVFGGKIVSVNRQKLQ